MCDLSGRRGSQNLQAFDRPDSDLHGFPARLRWHTGRTHAGMTTRYKRDLRERAFELATIVFRMFPELAAAGSAHGYVAQRLLRAASSIGANLEEGHAPSSRRDMAQKHRIALREAREANYWSRLLATDSRWRAKIAAVVQETGEFVAMLTVSVKKLREPATTPDAAALRVDGRARRSRRVFPPSC
jgi:four helix bundle protein